MFDLRCQACDAVYLVGARSLVSLQHTTEGPVGYLRCPRGHVTVVEFRSGAQRTAVPVAHRTAVGPARRVATGT